jgi:acyl-CoA thioester hydrolase
MLDTGTKVVPPEWIDYNGHMMDAYYFLAFTAATEVFLDCLGIGAEYHASTGCGIYTAEAHLCFLAGVRQGAVLKFGTELLWHDAKRLHVLHVMTSQDASPAATRAATCELMFLHVGPAGRVCPLPPDRVAAVSALAAAQHGVVGALVAAQNGSVGRLLGKKLGYMLRSGAGIVNVEPGAGAVGDGEGCGVVAAGDGEADVAGDDGDGR